MMVFATEFSLAGFFLAVSGLVMLLPINCIRETREEMGGFKAVVASMFAGFALLGATIPMLVIHYA